MSPPERQDDDDDDRDSYIDVMVKEESGTGGHPPDSEIDIGENNQSGLKRKLSGEANPGNIDQNLENPAKTDLKKIRKSPSESVVNHRPDLIISELKK